MDYRTLFPVLMSSGVAFFAREETGGLSYYNLVTRWPHFSGHESGVTIGVGYDLRFNSEADFIATWGPHLPADDVDELIKDIGRKGSKARTDELKAKGIEVPFKSAWPVLTRSTLPRFYDITKGISHPWTIWPTCAVLPWSAWCLIVEPVCQVQDVGK